MFGRKSRQARAEIAHLEDVTAAIRGRGVAVPETWRVLARLETSNGEMIMEGRTPSHTFPPAAIRW